MLVETARISFIIQLSTIRRDYFEQVLRGTRSFQVQNASTISAKQAFCKPVGAKALLPKNSLRISAASYAVWHHAVEDVHSFKSRNLFGEKWVRCYFGAGKELRRKPE